MKKTQTNASEYPAAVIHQINTMCSPHSIDESLRDADDLVLGTFFVKMVWAKLGLNQALNEQEVYSFFHSGTPHRLRKSGGVLAGGSCRTAGRALIF